MKTLYDQLKPAIKAKLDAQQEEYSISINYLYKKLKEKKMYSELTIDEVKVIHTFGDMWYNDLSGLDLMYGNHIFNN
jgi:hypothetical protein